MTIEELIKELKKWPQNMPVACYGEIDYPPENYKVDISKRTWIHTNYPWNKPEFEYINLE